MSSINKWKNMNNYYPFWMNCKNLCHLWLHVLPVSVIHEYISYANSSTKLQKNLSYPKQKCWFIGANIDPIPLRCRKESLFMKWGMPLGSTMNSLGMTETDLYEFEPRIFHSQFSLTSKSCQLLKWPIWAFLMIIAVWCTMGHG